jgi:hypothetical protein
MNASALVAVAARLALSKAPAEELAATAAQAAHNAQLVTNDGEGTQRIDYVIIAVPAGRGLEVAPRLEQLARAEP